MNFISIITQKYSKKLLILNLKYSILIYQNIDPDINILLKSIQENALLRIYHISLYKNIQY